MHDRHFDLLVVGDVNIDIILGGMAALPRPGTEELAADLDFRSGGSAANCARAAAKLGARVAFAGLIGQDRFGDFVLDAFGGSGVNTDYLRRSAEVSTGLTVSLSMAGERAFATYLGSNAALCDEHLDTSALARARHLHVGGYFLLRGMRRDYATLMRRAKEDGLTTSLDCGWDPEQRWNGELSAVLESVDVLLPNEVEVRRLAGEDDLDAAVARLAARVPTVAVKLGAQGALGQQGGRAARAPAFPVQVLDTTALGDAFNAGFLVAHLEGRPLAESLRTGNAAAAIAASRMGDDRYASRDEVERMMAGGAN